MLQTLHLLVCQLEVQMPSQQWLGRAVLLPP